MGSTSLVRQQARVALGNMQHDRPCLEQSDIAFLIGRNLAERMKRPMRWFLHRTERNETNLVGLAHFFERPANTRITRQSLAAIG
jgi:predicted mannosyl-3-phosphoglycerate phosphatase (HAD superfamily)